jgi:hypothetical protein
LREKKFRPILEDSIFWRRVPVAPQYGTSGSKLKKSLGEGRADIHAIKQKKEERNRMTGFFCDPVMFEKSD